MTFFLTIMKRTLFFLPLVLLMVLAALYGASAWQEKQSPSVSYQAVFLTNGQVYFGKVRTARQQWVTLADIYYLQTRLPLQEQGEEKDKKPAEPELTLVKLGEELHGPYDRMDINRDNILFIEDLRDEGRVVAAIKKYKNK